ncbi:MAG TPA: DUF3667 domain-containing protein [Casimicrobiaceae bacterium]|nr:DUF3667 domain-containing protein [Casimicrobiaceae bacterium]
MTAGAPVPPAEAQACRNCAHALAAGDVFCAHCGQETKIALPTARQFMREAAGRYVAFDGRLWRTLRALLVRPGFLTREYFAGRRRRYVRPGRLFLVTSIVAFAAIRLAIDAPFNAVVERDLRESAHPAQKDAAKSKAGDGGAQHAAPTSGAPSAPSAPSAAAAARDAARADADAPRKGGPKPARDAGRDAGDDDDTAHVRIGPGGDVDLTIDSDLNVGVARDRNNVVPAAIRERIEQFNHLPRDVKLRQLMTNVFRYGPYAAIALLPAFAILLMIVYPLPSRRYPERPRRFAGHLVLAAHNHAFLFTLTTLVIAIDALASGLGGVAKFLFFVGAPVYLLMSLRAVYGGGWTLTLFRGFLLFLLYAVLFAFVTLGLLLAAIVLQ